MMVCIKMQMFKYLTMGFLLVVFLTLSFGFSVGSNDLVMGPGHVGMLTAGRNIVLKGTSVSGNVMAGRAVKAENCQIMGNLSAGQDVVMQDCDMVNMISAGRHLQLRDTKVNQHVSAGGDIKLSNATIQGDVSAGGKLSVEYTQIGETLSASIPHLILNGSTVKNIQLSQPSALGESTKTSWVAGNGNLIASNAQIVIRGAQKNGSYVSVRSGSVSTINGYTVKGGHSETTVIAPNGNIYVNGRKVFGSGPNEYSEYHAQTPGSPFVTGPGWERLSASQKSEPIANDEVQIVELINNSSVTGTIRFEHGNGKVIVQPGSQFLGTVEGGSVQRL